jgi:hypothetical protein
VNTISDVCGNENAVVAGEVRLDLILTDRDVVKELTKRVKDCERDACAQAALKVGVLAGLGKRRRR